MTTKKVLITGASSGFGLLAVKLLLAENFQVIAGIRGGESRLRQIAPELANPIENQRLQAIDLHVDRPETFSGVADWIKKNHGGQLDILINNAGFGLLGPVEEMTEAEIRYQFEVNVFGPILLTRALLPLLRKSRGRILNVSSIAGLMSFPFYNLYNSTKHALEGHTEALRYEMKPFGVQVGLIEPGGFQTDFATRSLQIPARASEATSPYGTAMISFTRFLAEKASHGGKAIRVAELLVRLCKVRSVPMRSIIGSDARVMASLKWLLPETFRVNFTNWIFWKFLLRKSGVPKRTT